MPAITPGVKIVNAVFSFNRSVRIGSRQERITGDSGALTGRELLRRSKVLRFLAKRLVDRRPLPKPMLAVSCLVLCAACLGDASDPGATGRAAVVDLFSAWPGDESLRIAAEPSLVVGLDESLPLGRVSGAVFFGDGIAIADVQSHEVLILDAAGRLLSRQGRNGEGPGEYKHLAGIARHADGLITWDAYHFRLTLLDASGGYVGDTKVKPNAMSVSRTRIGMMVGAFGNSVLFETSELGFPGTEAVGPMEIRLPVEYEIARLSDGEVVFEGTRPGVEKWATREVHGDGGQTHGGLPVIFGRTAVSAVTDRYAYLATTDSITITRYDEAGTAVEVSFEQPRKSAEAAGCGSSVIAHGRISRVEVRASCSSAEGTSS